MWAARSLFKVLGGTSPKPPGRGRSPLHPLFPPSLAEGSPAAWVPLVAGLPEWATRPNFGFLGGHPQTPRHGASPPGPPFAHPRKFRVRQGFGSHPWRGFQSGLLAPSFGFVGGHPPQPPARGLAPPGLPFARPRWLLGPYGLCERRLSVAWRAASSGVALPSKTLRRASSKTLSSAEEGAGSADSRRPARKRR